jgi:phosphoheptose isomerase
MSSTTPLTNAPQSHADFEDLEHKYQTAIHSPEYQQLIKLVGNSRKIYVVANGGLHYVGSHMATDLTRLVPAKVVRSFDSFGFISSNANDHGWENTFVRWLETSAILDDPDTTMVYGMSCSGNSTNVIKAFEFARDRFGFKSFLLSGRPSKCKPSETLEICLNAEYYHTVETIGLMLFYDLVHKLGHACPVINR